MNTYTIYIGSTPIACVSGADAAYNCFDAAKTIAAYTDREASLVWDETGEEVAYYAPQEIEKASCYCEASNCGYYYIAEGDDYPCCHFEGAIAPCEEENYEPEDIDNDCGYDPYMGCYTDDC